MSDDTVRNIISLTQLVPELQQMVDDKKIAVTPAYQIAALKPEEQAMLVETIESEQATPSVPQAQRMKQLSQSGDQNDEPDDLFWSIKSCRQIWSVLCDDSLPLDFRDEGVARLRAKAEDGEVYAQLLLGRLYRDGSLLTPDWVEARHWFEQAAQTLPDAQYALGKLLLTADPEVHDREQGLCWLKQAAEGGHDYAAYRLGKELLKEGKVDEALLWLAKSIGRGGQPLCRISDGQTTLGGRRRSA